MFSFLIFNCWKLSFHRREKGENSFVCYIFVTFRFYRTSGNLFYNIKMIARVARIGRGVPELAGLLNETELGINWFVVCRPALSHFAVRFGSFEYVQKLASTIIFRGLGISNQAFDQFSKLILKF